MERGQKQKDLNAVCGVRLGGNLVSFHEREAGGGGGDGKRKGRILGIREGESKMLDSIFCVK